MYYTLEVVCEVYFSWISVRSFFGLKISTMDHLCQSGFLRQTDVEAQSVSRVSDAIVYPPPHHPLPVWKSNQ